MTGVIGKAASDGDVDAMTSALYSEPWYETEQWASERCGVALVDHGRKDPSGRTFWSDGDRAGVVYGVVSNADSLPWTVAELFENVLERPGETLPRLEGPFLIACVDATAGIACLATDKVASRPGYYTTADGFRFASELKPLIPALDDPTVDPDAVGDLLSFGAVVGERTVLEGIENLPPATYVRLEDGDTRTERYWYPDPSSPSKDHYAREWIDRYDLAMRRLADGIDGRLGLWLSGGVDSRVAAASLRRANREFVTFTYASEADTAKRVADAVDVPNRTFGSPTADEFVHGVRGIVGSNDAMQAWSYVPGLAFMFGELADSADVVMEGETFLGEDLLRSSFRKSPTEAVYEKRRKCSQDDVDSMLADSGYDPESTIRTEVEACRGNDRIRALDTVRRFYAYTHMRSNIVQRSQVGTRTVADGPMLEHVMSMPDDLRMGALPFTDGTLPDGVPQVKLDVLRRYGMGLDRIPYRRTGVSPSRHRLAHRIGFVAREAEKRLRPTSKFDHPMLDLYRQNATAREFLDGLLADARERPFLDADGVEDYRDRLLRGEESNITPVAALTGLELWLQENVGGPAESARHSVPTAQ